MSGAKGRSGGYRPGAGRKPNASTIDMKAKAKAKKVESLGEVASLPDTIKFKKLTAYFAKPYHSDGECHMYRNPIRLLPTCHLTQLCPSC